MFLWFFYVKIQINAILIEVTEYEDEDEIFALDNSKVGNGCPFMKIEFRHSTNIFPSKSRILVRIQVITWNFRWNSIYHLKFPLELNSSPETSVEIPLITWNFVEKQRKHLKHLNL